MMPQSLDQNAKMKIKMYLLNHILLRNGAVEV